MWPCPHSEDGVSIDLVTAYKQWPKAQFFRTLGFPFLLLPITVGDALFDPALLCISGSLHLLWVLQEPHALWGPGGHEESILCCSLRRMCELSLYLLLTTPWTCSSTHTPGFRWSSRTLHTYTKHTEHTHTVHRNTQYTHTQRVHRHSTHTTHTQSTHTHYTETHSTYTTHRVHTQNTQTHSTNTHYTHTHTEYTNSTHTTQSTHTHYTKTQYKHNTQYTRTHRVHTHTPALLSDVRMQGLFIFWILCPYVFNFVLQIKRAELLHRKPVWTFLLLSVAQGEGDGRRKIRGEEVEKREAVPAVTQR